MVDEGHGWIETRGTYDASLLNELFDARMVDEGHGWMYGGWKKSGAHMRELTNKTQFRPCILLTKQSGCEVPMQQIHKHSL
jgi:hypothetical protein